MMDEINVVIYGIGADQIYLETLLSDTVKIVAYTDSFARIEWYNNRRFINLDDLQKIEYDYIIVAIKSEEAREKVIRNLVRKYCEFEKIIDLWRISKVDRIMLNADKPWEGIVLGISLGDAGIEPRCFSKRFCNLAVVSQDLHENYLALKKCVEEYPEKLDLKYCVLDMFEYDYFNYDASLSRDFGKHLLLWGGQKSLHNVRNNKNMCEDEKEFLHEFCHLNEDVTLYKKMFKESCYLGNYQLHERRRIVEDREYNLQEIAFSKTRYSNRHNETIKENIEILEKIFKLLNDNYPGIRIILLHLPVFYQVQKILEPYTQQWKNEFISILDSLKIKYDFEYYDLRKYEPISKNSNFFYDVGHLNITGAIAMTSYLNKFLFETE